MKNFPLVICLLFSFHLFAQNECPGDKSGFIFQANRIGAFYSARGAKHWDFHNEFFKVPYASEKSPSTVFASSPWMGGYVQNQLRLSGQTYASKQDLFVGPLSPGANPYTLCDEFNHVWSVTRDEIMQHIQDFAFDGIIDDTLPYVFGWPAQGNPFFLQYNGFELPVDHQGGWASFTDLNQNNIYEPQLGEYPDVILKGKSVIPQAIAWMVFNDQGNHEQALTEPLGVEFQLTVFGFSCEDNPVLNNTLFNTYKIINQGDSAIDSAYFGMWTDYDLGCAADDYLGSDSARSSEFVYNDEEDGDVGFECSTNQETYEGLPPIQSMSYLSPVMNSFVVEQWPFGNEIYPTFHAAEDQYRMLRGTWSDGTPIRIAGDGYHVAPDSAITKFLFNGDPRDTNQWSMWNENINHIDPRSVSSVVLGSIEPGAQAIVETAYTFHQDSSLNHLEQFGPMYANLDSLLKYVDDIETHCTATRVCMSQDCVWPGDFNHNGKADHFDLLYWGVMKENSGAPRDGRINWTGHFADPWSLTLPNGLNAKHGDGNGEGLIDDIDLDRNIHHFLLTNPYYLVNDQFPVGPELIMTASPMSANGTVRSFEVYAGIDLDHVLGLAYEVDFDTSLYKFEGLHIPFCPVDSNALCFSDYDFLSNPAVDATIPRYAFVKTDHQEISIDSGYQYHRLFNGFKLKDGKTLDDVPDTIVFRLKNLIALDAQGNDLHIGANVLKIPKYLVTGIDQPDQEVIQVFPNPVHDLLHLTINTAEEVAIVNALGQTIREITVDEFSRTIQVNDLQSGLYFLNLKSSGLTIRFVKQ